MLSRSISLFLGSLHLIQLQIIFFILTCSSTYCLKLVLLTPALVTFVGISLCILIILQYFGMYFLASEIISAASSRLIGVNFPNFHNPCNPVPGITKHGYIFSESG